MSTAPLDDLAALLAPLNTPFACKSLKAPNRFCMAPMSRYFAPGGVLGEDGAEYYRRRAAGGVGTIITEGTGVAIDHAVAADNIPLFDGEDGRAQLMPFTPKAECSFRNYGMSAAVWISTSLIHHTLRWLVRQASPGLTSRVVAP